MSSVSERFRFDTIKSVVRWRLADAEWKPSFETLLDDVHNCMNASASVQEVMLCLRELVKSDPEVAEAAILVAQDAQDYLRKRNEGRARIEDWDTHPPVPTTEIKPQPRTTAAEVVTEAFRGVLNRIAGTR